MLTQIKLKNFKSFKNETVISFVSTNYQPLRDKNVYNDIVKGSLFVGGNATGKTNIIYSISFLLDLLFINNAKNTSQNFCLFSEEPEMLLEYTFQFEKDKIVYALAFERNGAIAKEELVVNNEVKLKRIGLNAESFITEKRYYNQADIEAFTPFLKTIYFNTKFTSFPLLARWFDFLSNSVYFNATKLMVLPYNPNVVVDILQYLELNGVNEINEFYSYFKFNQQIDYGTYHKLSNYYQMESSKKEVYLKRNNLDIWMPMAFESLGNITLLNMLPALLHCVATNGMFIVDEFSSAFHNELEELIVEFFMNKSKQSQMFFVSHSTNLLKSSLLRPDQIYTVDFDDETGSRVKRVSSEHPRESQNFEKMYLSGIFDGLPNYKNDVE